MIKVNETVMNVSEMKFINLFTSIFIQDKNHIPVSHAGPVNEISMIVTAIRWVMAFAKYECENGKG